MRLRFASKAPECSAVPAHFSRSSKLDLIDMCRRQPVTAGLEVYRELLDKNDKPVTQTKLGEPIHVRLHARTVRDEPVTNVAIIDLLPGGFEVVGSSLQPGVSTIPGVDYVDVREDRAVFYATVSEQRTRDQLSDQIV